MSFRIPGSNVRRSDAEGPGFGYRVISSIVSDDLDEGLSWIIDDPRVTSRAPSCLPECLSLSIRLSPDVGATNEIKTLALTASISSSSHKSEFPASVKIYVDKGSNLGRISIANVIKSLLVDLINRGSRWMVGKPDEFQDIEVTHGKS